MGSLMKKVLGAIAIWALTASMPDVVFAGVDVILSPTPQTKAAGQIVEVTMSVRASGAAAEQFSGLGAIISWDSTKLQFINADTSGAGYPWFQAGFFTNPDGLNNPPNPTAGQGMYHAFASTTTPAVAPVAPAQLIVVKFRFLAIGGTPGTVVKLLPAYGTFSRTQVYGTTPGSDVTGDISSTVTVKIVAPCSPTVGDVNGDSVINAADIPAAIDVYLGFDTIPAHIVAADANCDGLANGADIQQFIELVWLWL